jgi:ABC-type dipeptide/oligopeptide/nickel transport system permease subunit
VEKIPQGSVWTQNSLLGDHHLRLIGVSLFARCFSYDPYEQSLAHRLKSPSTTYWLGTDQLGRDELSRIIYGSRVSLMVGIIAVSTAAVIGMTLGLISGFFGGWVDTAIMRIIDALMSIPPILLALAFASALGGGLPNLMIAIGIAMVPIYARLMRSLVLSAREMDFIMAGRVIGATNLRLVLRHILPIVFSMIVMITLSMGEAILIEAGLSFPAGIAPPGAAWGSMVNDGYRFLLSNPFCPWLLAFVSC